MSWCMMKPLRVRNKHNGKQTVVLYVACSNYALFKPKEFTPLCPFIDRKLFVPGSIRSFRGGGETNI